MASRCKINFTYKEGDYSYQSTRCIIIEKYSHRRIQVINWDPLSQAPFQSYVCGKGSQHAIRALRSFQEKLEAPNNVLRLRLEPGTCVVQDAMRVCCGREAISSGTVKTNHLYMDGEYLAYAYRSFGTTVTPTGTQDARVHEERSYVRRQLREERLPPDAKEKESSSSSNGPLRFA
ncbi:hypothetical protein DL765_003777 [Monosporascus sp. GIB2]|nr:hypothetical protein DL765_003777 [Monosporascus sp. GIB2]